MTSKRMTILTMTLAFLALPAGAMEEPRHGQQQPASAKVEKIDAKGGGRACKDGKCASKGQAKRGMGQCCCAGMMEKRACKMGSAGMDNGMHGMHGDDMAAEDMMERIRRLEERVETMQKALEQQPKG